MVKFGDINRLRIAEVNQTGIILDENSSGGIFLPRQEIRGRFRVNDEIEVFIFRDSKSQTVVTASIPRIMAGQFGVLKVITSNSYGAFLDWGLKPDLRVPASEQHRKMKAGQSYPVFVYNDKQNRITASSRLRKFFKEIPEGYQEGRHVDLMVVETTPVGYRAVIDGKYSGVLYKNEVFQILEPGAKVRGFIKKIRPDGKVDLSLRKSAAMEADLLGKKILDVLKERGGVLEISDRTDPEKIYSLFGVSKKRYKNAIGALYKRRIIIIENNRIRLNRKKGS